MLYKLTEVVDKNEGWKVVSIEGVDGVVASNVSVSKTKQDGTVNFPNFAEFTQGAMVEGEYKEYNGKKYLYPSRAKPAGGARKGVDPLAIAKAQEHKAENIRAAQDNKDQAIRLSGAMNHAVNIVTTFSKDLTPDEIKNKVLNWRNWFLDNWDLPEADASEIPF